MKITSIRLVGLKTITLPILDALPGDPYSFKSADGLGPPGVDVTLSKAINLGLLYKGRRPQGREIVLKVGLNPNYAIGQTTEELRTDLYGLFTPAAGELIVVQFLNDGAVVALTNGTVSKFENDLFSKDPAVQLTIPCLEAYLQAPAFVAAAQPLDRGNPLVNNPGTAATGIRVSVTFNAALPSWSIKDASGKILKFDFAFQVGDKLEFSTIPGERSCFVTRGTQRINMLRYLAKGYSWIALYGGGNSLVTSSQSFIWNSFSFKPQFLGV